MQAFLLRETELNYTIEESDMVGLVHQQFSRFDPTHALRDSDRMRELAKKAR